MGEGKISLKLFVDKNENRVIYAEAGKDFVDFLFHFLSLPVGTVVKLLSNDKMVGSLGKIYESVETMNSNFMEPNVNKEYVLNPRVSPSYLADTSFFLGFKSNYDELTEYALYNCGRTSKYHDGSHYIHLDVSRNPYTQCSSCRNLMNMKMNYVKSTVQAGKSPGYVKGLVTYMVMDDLQVMPLLSSTSSINLLKGLVAPETMEVFIKKEEAVDSLVSH